MQIQTDLNLKEPKAAINISQEGVVKAMGERDFKIVRSWFKNCEIADIAETFEDLDMPLQMALFRLVPKVRRASLFSYFNFDLQEEFLEELPEVVVTSVVNDMEPDDRTRLLEELPFEIRSQIMLKLSPEERKMAWQLLSYPEDSVGRLMTPEFLILTANTKVSEALEMIRWGSKYPEDQLHYLFVTDKDGKYLGDLSLSALVMADPPTKKIREVMSANPVAVNADEDQEAAVDFFRKYERPFLAVIDNDETLLGIVTADDVFDVAEEEATEDIQQFGGAANLEDSYFSAGLPQLFSKRIGWLIVMFVGGVLTAALLRRYEAITTAMAWLVFFVPLIISSGGNTGSQSAALVIRGLAVKEMSLEDWNAVLWRETRVGLSLGVVLGIMGFILSQAWNMEPIIGVIVAIALCGITLFGGVIGSMLPFIFKKLKLDPAVSSSPLLASLVDIIGVLVFYNLAEYVIKWWEARG
jgi:magnesium transporter